MCEKSYFLLLRLSKHRLQNLDVAIYSFRHFISKIYFAYLRIFDVIACLQQKRSFVVVFAITLLSILLN